MGDVDRFAEGANFSPAKRKTRVLEGNPEKLKSRRSNGPPPDMVAAYQRAAAYHGRSKEIFQRLQDKDWATRHAACLALVHMGQLRGMQETHFERFKENDDPSVRYWASLSCKIQNSMPTSKLAEEVAGVLASEDAVARFAALVALIHLGDPGALYARRVACLMDDPEPKVRAEAARALALLARDRSEPFSPNAAPQVLARADDATDEPASPRFGGGGESPYRGFRARQAIVMPEAAMLSKAALAVPTLAATGAADRGGRRGALFVANAYPTSPASPASPASPVSPASPESTKLSPEEYAERCTNHRRAALLIPAVGGEAAVVCKEIRSALVLRDNPRFLQKLSNLIIYDKDQEVRGAAAWALGELGAISQANDLATLAKDPNAGPARELANYALRRFGKAGERALEQHTSEKKQAEEGGDGDDDELGDETEGRRGKGRRGRKKD